MRSRTKSTIGIVELPELGLFTPEGKNLLADRRGTALISKQILLSSLGSAGFDAQLINLRKGNCEEAFGKIVWNDIELTKTYLGQKFSTTQIQDPNGNQQYPYFWTGTTHLDSYDPVVYDKAVYIAFGEAQGKMNGVLYDVHGAGAQRSDPKSGDPNAFPDYLGPQGDVRYMLNYVRCVRNID